MASNTPKVFNLTKKQRVYFGIFSILSSFSLSLLLDEEFSILGVVGIVLLFLPDRSQPIILKEKLNPYHLRNFFKLLLGIFIFIAVSISIDGKENEAGSSAVAVLLVAAFVSLILFLALKAFEFLFLKQFNLTGLEVKIFFIQFFLPFFFSVLIWLAYLQSPKDVDEPSIITILILSIIPLAWLVHIVSLYRLAKSKKEHFSKFLKTYESSRMTDQKMFKRFENYLLKRYLWIIGFPTVIAFLIFNKKDFSLNFLLVVCFLISVYGIKKNLSARLK